LKGMSENEKPDTTLAIIESEEGNSVDAN